MAKNQAPRENTESVESAKRPDTDFLLLDRAVKEFVAERFEEGRIAFFTDYFQANGIRESISKKFKDFVSSKDGYRTLANENVDVAFFDHEIRKTGYAMSTSLEASVRAISTEFDFGSDAKRHLGTIRKYLSGLRKNELAKIASSPKEREKAMKSATRLNPDEYRNDVRNYLRKMKDVGGRFTDSDIENVERYYAGDLQAVKLAFRKGVFSQDEARTIIGLMTNDETKRLLMRAFLPSVSLGELVAAKIIDRKEAKTYLLAKIRKDAANSDESSDGVAALLAQENGPLGKTGSENWRLEEIVDTFDLDDVFVDTEDLDPEHLRGAVLKTRLPKTIEERVSQGMKEIEGALATDFEISEAAGAKNYRAVAKKIVESFSVSEEGGRRMIGGIERLATEEHWKGNDPVVIEGTAKFVGSGDELRSGTLRIRIERWNECPDGAGQSGTGNRTVTVTTLDELGNPQGQREVSYSELFRVLSSLNGARTFEKEDYGKQVRLRDRNLERAGTADSFADPAEYEAALNEEIPNLAELVARLDEIDPAGAHRGLAVGTGFALERPGRPGYNVATVVGIDEVRKTVKLRNTHVEGSRQYEELSFGIFYLAVKDRSFSRMAAANSARGVIELVANSPLKARFEGIVAEEDRFVPKSRRDENDYEGLKIFYGAGGKAFEVGVMENERVQIRLLKDFDKGEQGKGKMPSATPTSDYAWCGYETLYRLIQEYEATPFEGVVKPKAVHEPEYESHGTFKKFLNHASFNDIVHGLAEIPKFVKAKFEHSSHHHAAHMTLAVAGMIPGFPSDWLTDLQMQIHSEDKSTMEKEVQRLNGFPSPKRHAQVLKYLLNHGSHDYEIIAGMLSLLEKHGNLYPGPLAYKEKDWLFFARMPGDAGEKERFLHKLRAGENGEKKEVKEVDAIMLWLKEKANDSHHPINPHYWLQVKKLWRTGASSEFDMGVNEAKGKETFADRSKYVVDKFKGKEYAHGIGALQEVWNKPSASVHDRMKIPFILAMSEIRTQIHSDLAEKFTGMFDAGHVYPPLLFIQFPERQALFRRVVNKLCGNEAMSEDLNVINRLIAGEAVKDSKGEPLDLVDVLDKFWNKHGKTLGKKLFVTVEDPEVLMSEDEDIKEYYRIVSGELDDTKFDDAELSMGTYGAGNVNWAMINTGKFVKTIKFQGGPGKLDNNPLPNYFFGEFVKTLELLRVTKYHADPERDDEIRRRVFEKLHSEFMEHLQNNLSSDWWKIDNDTGVQKIYSHGWMGKLARLGLRVAQSQDPGNLEGDAYRKWLKDDYERFMGSGVTSGQVHDRVAVNVDDIIGHPPTVASMTGNPVPNPPAAAAPGRREPETSGSEGSETAGPAAEEPEPAEVAETGNGGVPGVENGLQERETVQEGTTPEDGDENVFAPVTPTFRERYAPVVDRIVARFGTLPKEMAETASKNMAESLRKAGIEVPEDIRNAEWAYSKIVERFLELEPHEFFREARDIEGFVEHDLLSLEEIFLRLGSEVLSAVRKGTDVRIEHLEAGLERTHLAMLIYSDDANWEIEDIEKAGEAIYVEAP